MTLEEYTAKHLLDNERYRILDAVPQGRSWVIVQAYKPPAKQHYCLQYAGNGHYFDTLDELNKYAWQRWRIAYPFNGGVKHGKAKANRSF